MSFLIDHGLSSYALSFKKSCVSSLCNYIENVVADEEEDLKTFRNFTKGLPSQSKNQVYEKVLITEEEYKKMMEALEKENDYLGMAWLTGQFFIGTRRSEILQFKTEILDYPVPEGKNYVVSHPIRAKGKGKDGNVTEYMIPLEALKYFKLWIEKRGFESEYIFAVKRAGKIQRLSRTWSNYFCQHKLSEILGRRITVHNFKAAVVSNLLIKGVDMKIVSKYVAHHKDVLTTSSYYDLRDFEEEKDKIFSIPDKK
jgi:integrase